MKKVIFTVVLCAGITAAFAQTPAKPTPAAKPAPAGKPAPAQPADQKADQGYKFDKTVHDYGTIKKGADPYCEFKITNTSKEPLVITSAVGSCGCTVPKYDTQPVMPGKSTTIQVKYDTNRIGPFEKQVTIQFQGKDQPAVIKIKGTVEAPPADTPFPAPGNGNNSGAPVNN